MKKSSSARNTFIVMIFTFISRILGFVRTALVNHYFGVTKIADAITLTFAVPNNLRKLMAEGALSSAFIPTFNKTLIDDPSRQKSRKLVNNVITFQLLVLVPVCLICVLFARQVVDIVISDFKDPAQIELSAKLLQWFIFYILFISVSAVIMGVLNTHKNFLIPAVTPVLFSICVISCLMLFYKTLGEYSMVLGVLLGGAAQLVFQLPWLKNEKYKIRLNFDFKNSGFKEILKNYIPVLATSSIFTITQVIANRFASGLDVGSTTVLFNAIVIFQLPYGLFFASVTTVLFPKMSRFSAADNLKELRNTMQYGIRFLLVLLIPSMIILFFLGTEMAAVLYMSGKFTLENAVTTGAVLQGYTIGLFALGIFNFLQRFFFSKNNHKIPFVAAGIVGIIDIVLSIIFINIFENYGRVYGLALANSISFVVGMVFLLIIARKHVGGLNIKSIIITFLKISAAVIPLIGILVLSNYIFKDYWQSGRSFVNFLILGGKAVFSGGILFICYKLFKVEMFRRKKHD